MCVLFYTSFLEPTTSGLTVLRSNQLRQFYIVSDAVYQLTV